MIGQGSAVPRTLLHTAIAMIAFAANSLLARGALADGAIDAASFTAIRLISGALMLGLLIRRQARSASSGSWASGLCLFAYAIGFSLAYLRLGAATGALILFAAVQASMIGWGLLHRHHMSRAELAGLAIALSAFVALLLPGLHTPDPLGALLMVVAGIAWGAYSLRGRGAASPLAETAGNFSRAARIGLPLVAWSLWQGHVTGFGIALAMISGAIASGLGYAIWYRALPNLRPTQAASVQLTVPLIAAIGAVLVLSEQLTPRLIMVGACLLGGVGLTIAAKGRAA